MDWEILEVQYRSVSRFWKCESIGRLWKYGSIGRVLDEVFDRRDNFFVSIERFWNCGSIEIIMESYGELARIGMFWKYGSSGRF